MNNFGLLLRKYSVPVLFTIIGLLVLIYGFSNGQNAKFLFAAAMMLAAGVLSGLFSMGKLRPIVVIATGVGFGIVAIWLLVLSFTDVKQTLKYEADRDLCVEMAKQNLIDIRFLQETYKKNNGKYIDNWDDLVAFAKEGTMPIPIAKGTVPKDKITSEERDYLYNDNRPIDYNMTEEEAYRLSKWKEGPRYNELFKDFVRDTIQKSIMDTKFKSKGYIESREKAGLKAFDPDKLPYIPFTENKKWNLQVRDSVKMGEIVGPSIEVRGTLPFGEIEGTKDKIEMYFGNISTLDTEGSWEKED